MTVYTQISQNNWPSTKNQYDDYLVLSCPFNAAYGYQNLVGTVGSKNIRQYALSIESGAPAVTTSESKFYGSSFFLGANSVLLTPSLPIANTPYTIECWVKGDTFTSSAALLRSPDVNIELYWSYQNVNSSDGQTVYKKWRFEGSMSSNNVKGDSDFSATYTTWHHIAVTRNSSNVVNMFLNGTLQTVHASTTDTTNRNARYRIGPASGSGAMYVNDLRIYAGIAKYTANFTPPGPILGSA